MPSGMDYRVPLLSIIYGFHSPKVGDTKRHLSEHLTIVANYLSAAAGRFSSPNSVPGTDRHFGARHQ